MSFSWFIVKIRYRISRGQSWLYYIKDIAYVGIALYLIEDVLKKFGITDPTLFKYLYIITPIAYFIGCYIIGYFDEKYGIWKKESIYGSKDLNPFMENLNTKIEEIHEKVVKNEYQ